MNRRSFCLIFLMGFLLLTGCSPALDGSRYMHSLMDTLYKASYTDYAELTGTTTAEVSTMRDTWMSGQTDRFLKAFNAGTVSDDMRARASGLLNNAFAQLDFSVEEEPEAAAASGGSLRAGEDVAEGAGRSKAAVSAESSGADAVSGSDKAKISRASTMSRIRRGLHNILNFFTGKDDESDIYVYITVRPLLLIENNYAALVDYQKTFNEKNTAYTYADLSSEAYADTYMDGLLTILEQSLFDIPQGPPQTIAVPISQNEDGLFTLDPAVLKRLQLIIFPLEAPEAEAESGETAETAAETETQAPAETQKVKETQTPKKGAETTAETETQVPAETKKVKETQAPAETESEAAKETKAPAETQKVKETKAP